MLDVTVAAGVLVNQATYRECSACFLSEGDQPIPGER